MEYGQIQPLGLQNPEPIHMKFGMFDYVHRLTPHANYGSRRKWG